MARFKIKMKGSSVLGDFMLWVFGLLLSAAFIYGMYWLFKTFSYWLFYEDMVQETVKEMIGRYVSQDSLK